MQAAAGEEAFVGVGRVAPLQRRLQHAGQIRLRVGLQVVDRPAAQVILAGDVHLAQLGRGLACVLPMQFGDDLQVGGQHAQLGGRAQFELAALVDIERLVGTVGLYPHPTAGRGALEQGEAVAHLRSLLRGQQALAEQADLPGELRFGQLLQVVADLLLQVVLQGAAGGEV